MARIPSLLGLVVAFAALSARPAFAQTYVWNTDAAGTWDTTTTNWLLNGAGAPTTYSSASAIVATFGDAITANRAIAMAAGGVTAGVVNFSSGPFFYTVGTAANDLSLNNGASAAEINVLRGTLGAAVYSGVGGNTITGSNIAFVNNLNITNNGAFGTTALTIAGGLNGGGGQVLVSGQGNTSISGAIGSGVSGLVMGGTGTLNLSGITNVFTGGITINSGVVSLAAANDGVLGNVANGVAVNGGGTLRFASAVPLSAARVLTIGGTSASPSGIDLGSSVAQIIGASQLSGTATNVANVTLTGGTTAGFLSVEGANAGYSGTLNVGTTGLVGSVLAQRIFATANGATLRLQNAGNLSALTNLNLFNGAALQVTNGTTLPAQNLTDRFNNAAAITSHSGRILFTGPDTVAASETLGNLTVTGLTLVNPTNEFHTINLGTITQADRGVLYFRGAIGGAVPSATVNNIFVSGGLTPVFVPAGDGTTGPLTGAGTGVLTGVIPFIGANTSTTSTDPRSFATYDANGLRVLLQTDTAFFSQIGAGGTFVDFANNHITGSSPAAITGTKIINSLAVSSGATLTGAGTLRINSGAIATFSTFSINGPTLDFGTATGYFHSGFGMNVQGTSSITGSNGFVLSSLGVSSSYRVAFTNTVANPFTGGLVINGNAQVSFTANNQLGNAGGFNAGAITLGGGQLLFVPSAAASVTLSDTNNRDIRVNESNGTIGTGLAASTLTIPGLISGPGQLQFGGGVTNSATGVVELTNTSANTYTGGTLVSAGILRISNPNQLGTGAVLLNGGTLQASGNLTFAAAPTVIASGTIDTQGNSIALNGGLNGSAGTLGTSALGFTTTKNGTGTLTIAGAGNYAGGITISALGGTVTLSGNGRLPELGAISVGRSGTFNLDNSATNIADRVGRGTNLTLTNNGTTGGATVNLTTNASGSTFNFGTLAASGGGAGNINSSTINLIDGGAGNHTVTFLSLTSLVTNNVLNFTGTANFGGTAGSGTHVFFRTTPSLPGGLLTNVNFTGFGGSGPASYDATRGVILFTPSAVSGNLLDNIATTATPSPTNALPVTNTSAFTASGAYDVLTTARANTGAQVYSLTLSGFGVTLFDGNASLPGNGSTAAGTLSISGGLLTSNTGPVSILSDANAARTVTFGGQTATVTANTDLTLGAGITFAGSGGLTKAGAGALAITTTYSQSGQTTVTAGSMTIPAAQTTLDGGLSLTAGTFTGAGLTSIGGLTYTAGTLTTGTLATIAGSLNSNATLTLPSVTSVTGATNVTAGTLTLASNVAVTGVVTVSGGATVAAGGSFSAGSLAGAGSLAVSGAIALTGATDATFTGSLAGGTTFTKSGTAIQTLTPSSSLNYSGATTVSSGSIVLGVNNPLPTTTALTIGNTTLSNLLGAFTMGGFNQTVSSLTLVAPSGTTTRLSGVGTLTVNGPVSYVNNTVDPNNDFPVIVGTAGTVLDLGGAVRNFGVVANANTIDLQITAVIQNGGVNYTGTTANTSAGAMQFNGLNTFNGGLTVNAGVIGVTSASTLGAATNAVTILATGTAGVATNSTIATGSAQTIGSLSGGTVSGTAVATLSLGGNLTVNQAAGSTTYGGLITGTGFGVTKSGNGALNLTGANTYTGLTTVSGGTLSVNNTSASATGTGNVSVGASGTLGGGNLAGTAGFIVPALSGNVTVDGTIAPGNSVGTITLGSATIATTLNLNGTLRAEVTHPDADRIVVFGNLNLGGSSILELPNTNTYDAATTYTLLSFTGTRTGTFNSITGLPITHGIDYSGATTIVLVPVPEPGTILGLSAIGLGLLTYGRRRLRREPVLAVAA